MQALFQVQAHRGFSGVSMTSLWKAPPKNARGKQNGEKRKYIKVILEYTESTYCL
jgi:hypothetical protein